MKFILTKVVGSIFIGVGILAIANPSAASSDKYTCQEINGVYGIYSRTPRGNMNLLNFNRDVSEEWSIEQRCNEVAQRFQRYYDNGILRVIGASYVNNEPALCAVVETGIACDSNNILVTLPPQSNPTDAARLLMDTRGLARGRVISVNGKAGKLESYVNGNTYYDLEVLEQLILEQKNSDRLIEN